MKTKITPSISSAPDFDSFLVKQNHRVVGTQRPSGGSGAWRLIVICLCSLLGLLATGVSPAQPFTFTTIAGLAGQLGVGDGEGESARFDTPSGVVADSTGNLFVSDSDNNRLCKLTHNGTNWTVTTIAGQMMPGVADGTSSSAQFNYPVGLAIDTNNNLFVADVLNNTVRKVSPSGTNWHVTTIAGLGGFSGSVDGTNDLARFDQPTDVAIDSNGNLYVTDFNAHLIRRISREGTNWIVKTIAGSTPGVTDGTNSAARFAFPASIAIDPAGNLYTADRNSHLIRKITPVGTNWVVKKVAGLAWTSGSADGTNSAARFNHPFGIESDPAGNLYVSDGDNHLIRKISPVGTNWVVSTIGGFAGQPGTNNGTGAAARFDHPLGLSFDFEGRLYVADSFSSTIRLGIFRPALTAGFSGNQLILSWPMAASNYVLEATGFLGATASWAPVATPRTVSGDCFSVSNTVNAPSAFYRLHK